MKFTTPIPDRYLISSNTLHQNAINVIRSFPKPTKRTFKSPAKHVKWLKSCETVRRNIIHHQAAMLMYHYEYRTAHRLDNLPINGPQYVYTKALIMSVDFLT